MAKLSGAGRSVAGIVCQLVFVAVLLRGALLERYPLYQAREHAFEQRSTSAALLTGVSDRQQIENTFPDASYILSVVPYMREHRLSIFSEPNPVDRNAFMEDLFQLANPGACQGEVQSVDSINNATAQYLRISGWAWDMGARRPVNGIFAAADGRIVGLGAVGDSVAGVRADHPQITTSFVGFTLYAQRTSEPLEIYAISSADPSQACEIATLQPAQMR